MGSSPAITDRTPFVVLFDGVCNLCSASVQFIIRRDVKNAFRFASLQSEYGQQQLKKYGLPADELYSIIVVDGERAWNQADAILKIVSHLKSPWPLLTVFYIVPRFIRNAVYRLVARNRYRLFGKKDACMIPTPELKARFIE